jgi:hypothetical protein
MRTFKAILFIVAASFAITSCKKDKDKESKVGVLTASPWFIVKYEEKENNGAWVNTFPGFSACSKDDKWIFKTNMSVDLTEGATACTGNTPDEVLESTTWALVENETKLKIESDVFTIEQLDANTFIFSIAETISGVTSSTRVTMGH